MLKKRFKIGYFLMIGMSLILIMSSCSKNETNDSKDTGDSNETSKTGEQPIVTITMENEDTIEMELYPDSAPNTVDNFISLIQDDFYDGVIFHRVIPGFMIQGGDPEGSGAGGPGYAIKGEFSSNGVENDLKHERGVISMARSGDPDSAGSQFFIMVDEATHLDGDYAAFGKVIDGMDTVDNIVRMDTDQGDKPVEEQTMKTVEVDLNGYDFSEPDKM